ncbi:putative G-patch domain protein [Aspergillus lucknowensis]|uniref:G-patch domain-containing protein n=1 Tax=Aspergillus lucknowensis TaxID=176173 RepID=A0ABR4L9Q6_9EURO
MSNYEDEDYFVPLEDQRVFGAGITKKRVPFVRSSDHELSTLTSSAPNTPSATGSSIANKYLSIVMPKPSTSSSSATASSLLPPPGATPDPTPNDRSRSAPPSPTATTATCEICNLPLPTSEPETDPRAQRKHESSLVHQVCLTHSHPPSHLDRTRHGLRYLESYGWDPDSRLGLGATGREGIREPLKGKLKVDTVGLGAVLPSPTSTAAEKRKTEKVQKLNAKQMRKGHVEARRKGEKLREMFYRDDDVLRYLGTG